MKKLIFALTSCLLVSSLTMAQENRSNPYDYVGQLHNQILQESLKSENKSTNEIPDLVENNALTNADFVSRFPSYTKNPELIKGIINTGINDYNNNFRSAISQLNISEDAKTYSQRLVDYMFNGGVSSNPPTYADFNTFVVTLEQDISSNSKLSETDKQAILCGTSTARYTLEHSGHSIKAMRQLDVLGGTG